MKQPSFSAAVFVAIASLFFFSGQLTRPGTLSQQRQPVQTQQRQPVQQRQVQPPKATPSPAKPAMSAALPETGMPSLFWLPEDIKFQEGASRTIPLLGDPKSEGLYVSRTMIPKGTQTIPHSHPDSRAVTVLSGVCYYGRGEVFDDSGLIPMPPGSFFTEPAGIPHFIWAKDGDVILQTTAIGPSGTTIIPDKKPRPEQGRP